MQQVIEPLNITSAALAAQFVILVMLGIAAAIVRSGEPRDSDSDHFPWSILAVALITIGALMFTDPQSKLWKPLFSPANFEGIQWSTGLMIAFTFDLVLIALLVTSTYGSYASPFSPAYFLIPVLAIFLREPVGRVIFYSALVAVLFTIGIGRGLYGERQGYRLAYWFVSVGSFTLATVIGLITRPR